MSEVYRARLTQDPAAPEVALKVLHLDPQNPEYRVLLARFQREVNICLDLNHPHILKILDHQQTAQYMYFASPLMRGGTLVDIIKGGPAAPEAVCHWVGQLADALDYAHKFDVVHRDIKPSNVLLDEDGNVYLTDFGIALLTSHTSNLTKTGIVVGTPAYMSPEQWRDDTLDGRADLYGLAVMSYLLLTQHTPFQADTAHSVMFLHLNESPPSMLGYRPDLSTELDQVLMKALAKSPAARYSSASDFAADFRRALNGETTIASLSSNYTVPHTPPASLADSYTPALSPVYAPPPPHYPIPPQARRHLERAAGRRRALTAILLVLALMLSFAVPVGLGLSLILNQDSEQDSGGDSSGPGLRPLDSGQPQVQIISPQNGLEVRMGLPVLIEVEAYDPQGLTRLELYRADTDDLLRTLPLEGQFETLAEFEYLPAEIGQHRLAVIAYRGEVAGPASELILEVR